MWGGRCSRSSGASWSTRWSRCICCSGRGGWHTCQSHTEAPLRGNKSFLCCVPCYLRSAWFIICWHRVWPQTPRKWRRSCATGTRLICGKFCASARRRLWWKGRRLRLRCPTRGKLKVRRVITCLWMPKPHASQHFVDHCIPDHEVDGHSNAVTAYSHRLWYWDVSETKGAPLSLWDTLENQIFWLCQMHSRDTGKACGWAFYPPLSCLSHLLQRLYDFNCRVQSSTWIYKSRLTFSLQLWSLMDL